MQPSLPKGILISLSSGQAFRFKNTDGVYKGVLKDRVYTLSESNLDIIESDENLRYFFDIDTDYEAIKEYLSSLSLTLKNAIDNAPHLRILRQGEEEMILTFVLTSCNNIPRITKMINALSQNYGKQVEDEYYTFPTSESIARATEDDLRKLGLGFRAPFILNIAKSIDSGKFDVDKIHKMDDREAINYLETLPGIGEKVASCILLFGYHRLNVFPKDVHIKRVMETYFKGKDETMFYPYAGVAQQFLFLDDLK